MASEAAVFSCFPLLFPEHLEEGLAAHQPKEVWYMTPMGHHPNRLVDISNFMEKKLAAVFCHQSQLELLADMFVTDADPAALTDEEKALLHEGANNLLRMVAQGLGTLSNGKAELVEAFYAIKVGAGHFDNYQIMLQEVMGMDADPIIIL